MHSTRASELRHSYLAQRVSATCANRLHQTLTSISATQECHPWLSKNIGVALKTKGPWNVCIIISCERSLFRIQIKHIYLSVVCIKSVCNLCTRKALISFKHLSPLSENYGSLGPRDIKKSPWFSQLIVENHS